MRSLLALGFFVGVLAACSGSHAPPPAPTRSGPPAPMLETAAPDDVQVATVEGRPVWGSCVSAQAARGATKEHALDECIGFELTAIEADKRGLATDRDVVLATHTALVSELVEHEYEDKYNRPEDFGTFWTKSLERNRARFDHDEVRGSVYVRIKVAKNADDPQAKQLIDEVYAALANERGLMAAHVEAIARRVIGTRAAADIKLVAPVLRHDRIDDHYLAALFAIPEVGRVAPPVRTAWGWDVVMWESVVPEVHATPDELVKAALPEIKRSYFQFWVARVARSLGVNAELVDANLPLMEKL